MTSSAAPPVFNEATFRQQFPAFRDKTAYPPTTLQFAWSMGASWISQSPTRYGLQGAVLQQAADLMGAVLLQQLYGPACKHNGVLTGGATAGPVVSAADQNSSATIKVPDFGTSAFSALLLSSPPYGTLLLSLLQLAGAAAPYIPSGRFSRVPP